MASDRVAAVGGAIDTEVFEKFARVRRVGYEGVPSRRGADANFVFKILASGKESITESQSQSISQLLLGENNVGERLARVEATQEALVRDVGDIKQDMRQLRTEMRTYFIVLITLIVTMWVSLIVTLVLRT